MHSEKRLLMQHRSSVCYRLDHQEQLLGCYGGVYTCTLGYTHPYVRPLLHWAGWYRGIPQHSGAMAAKIRVRPVAHWAKKVFWVFCHRKILS